MPLINLSNVTITLEKGMNQTWAAGSECKYGNHWAMSPPPLPQRLCLFKPYKISISLAIYAYILQSVLKHLILERIKKFVGTGTESVQLNIIVNEVT